MRLVAYQIEAQDKMRVDDSVTNFMGMCLGHFDLNGTHRIANRPLFYLTMTRFGLSHGKEVPKPISIGVRSDLDDDGESLEV